MMVATSSVRVRHSDSHAVAGPVKKSEDINVPHILTARGPLDVTGLSSYIRNRKGTVINWVKNGSHFNISGILTYY